MSASLFTIIVAAASMGSAFDSAQTAYMHCLDSEVLAAVSKRVDSTEFVQGAAQVCEAEKVVYRRMAIAQMVGQGIDGASPDAAGRRFDEFDRANRVEMIASYQNRMRLRRGPSRVAGLPVHHAQQD